MTSFSLWCKFCVMVRTQVQLPDELYARIKRLAEEREISLAELTRRALELLLDRYPPGGLHRAKWTLPRVDGGGIAVPLDELREVVEQDEQRRAGKA